MNNPLGILINSDFYIVDFPVDNKLLKCTTSFKELNLWRNIRICSNNLEISIGPLMIIVSDSNV
ncbi:hypothetical protein DHD05_18190 [Arenibacter sp. N53]|nr:hypothetical protein [Arenibacter sp. N53]